MQQNASITYRSSGAHPNKSAGNLFLLTEKQEFDLTTIQEVDVHTLFN
jgi:hypothetical protein